MPAVARAVTQFHHSRIRLCRRGQTPQWQDKIPVSFRGTTAFGFDVIRSSYGFFPHFLVEVSEEDVQAKLDALASYKTYSDKYYFDPSLLRATIVRHGALAERPYAEGFDILRIVGNFQTVKG